MSHLTIYRKTNAKYPGKLLKFGWHLFFIRLIWSCRYVVKKRNEIIIILNGWMPHLIGFLFYCFFSAHKHYQPVMPDDSFRE